LKKFDWAQTIQTVANVGVLAGLIFLAVEVSQNQSSIDEDAQLNTLESFNEFRNFIAQNEQLSEIWLAGQAGNELTPTESLRFGYVCLDYLFLFATNYSRFETQGRSAGQQQLVDVLQRQFKESPGLEACWERQKATITGFGYGAFVDAMENGR
jgi:hypothetical protein